MMKVFRKIHLWLSVPFGIIVALICFSGAMLVFEPEITRSVNSDVYYVKSAEGTAKPMDELMETVKQTLPDSVSVTGVTVFADKGRTYQVNLSKPRRASVFIDQYSGEITGKYERLSFFSTMFKLHRWLLDSANPHAEGIKVGKLLVGLSTLAFVIALITGIVIWWPRARKNLKRSLSISFSNGWKGFWKGLHVAGGMYALVLVLAMALTGLTWSFDWYRSAFYAVCGVEHTPRNMGVDATAQTSGKDEMIGRAERRGEGRSKGDRRGEGRHGGEGRGKHGEGRSEGRHGGGKYHHKGMDAEQAKQVSEFGLWQKVYDQLHAKYPDAPQITVSKKDASVTLSSYGNGRASDKYSYDNNTGDVKITQAYSDANGADKLRGWIYAIHTGALGGILTRIMWFLGALLGASLPLTGYYIWIKHMRRKKQPEHASKEANKAI